MRKGCHHGPDSLVLPGAISGAMSPWMCLYDPGGRQDARVWLLRWAAHEMWGHSGWAGSLLLREERLDLTAGASHDRIGKSASRKVNTERLRASKKPSALFSFMARSDSNALRCPGGDGWEPASLAEGYGVMSFRPSAVCSRMAQGIPFLAQADERFVYTDVAAVG